jgi:fructuronate reductase
MLIGQPDRAAIACEAFSQWVIEDRFASGRPDWEAEGVEMVADVRPYETMKLRLLNGAHSLLAYVGPRRGKRTVAAAICDPPLNRLIRDYFTEAAASLAPDTGIDAHAYTQSLLRRFSNDALEHQLSQIAIDGSQKLPQRWLHGALSNLEHGRSISTTAAGVAAWMAYVRGRNDAGQTWTVDDPLAAPLRRCHDENTSSDDIVAALLDLSAVFPAALASHPSFRRDVTRAFRTMMTGATDAD